MVPEERRLQLLSPSLTFNVSHCVPTGTFGKKLQVQLTVVNYGGQRINLIRNLSKSMQLVERLFYQSHGNALKFFSLSRWLARERLE